MVINLDESVFEYHTNGAILNFFLDGSLRYSQTGQRIEVLE